MSWRLNANTTRPCSKRCAGSEGRPRHRIRFARRWRSSRSSSAITSRPICRLTELIDATRARGDRKDRDELIDWIVRRSRIAVRWAAQLRRRGDAASSQRALALIEQAAKAMGDCERDVADLAVLPDQPNPAIERVYDFYWISSETWLAMGEIARDLGRACAGAIGLPESQEGI